MYNDNDRDYRHTSSTKEDGHIVLEKDLAIFAECETILKDNPYIVFNIRPNLKHELDLINYVLFAKEATKDEIERFYRIYPDVREKCLMASVINEVNQEYNL